jgi:hypothetical protein
MIEELRPFVARRRERVKPRLGGFLGWIAKQRLVGGPGIRVLETNDGTSISLDRKARQFFIGAFNCALVDETTATVGPGFVNGRMPTIAGQPLSDRPELTVPRPQKDPIFIMLKVTVDEATQRLADGDDAVTVVAEAKKPVNTRESGYHPIAVIYQQGGDTRLYQIAYFSYNHAWKDGKHFFVTA